MQQTFQYFGGRRLPTARHPSQRHQQGTSSWPFMQPLQEIGSQGRFPVQTMQGLTQGRKEITNCTLGCWSEGLKLWKDTRLFFCCHLDW